MSDAATLSPLGLAGLLTALAPRSEEPPPPPPDLAAIRAEGFDAGFEAGFAAGEAAREASLAPVRQQLAEAAAALAAATEIDVDRLRPVFAGLVEAIVRAVLVAEARAGTLLVLPLVEAALAQVTPADAPTLRAHPDTLAALASHLAALPFVATAADATLDRDAFAVTGPDFVIAGDLAERLGDCLAALA